jgi:type II secretory pathway pseudopilin PulG
MNERQKAVGPFRLKFLLYLLSSHRALSLLELLIALLILQIAITGFAQFFMGGLDLSLRTRQNAVAQILAQNEMEELLRTLPARAQASAQPVSGLLNERPAGFDSGPDAPETSAFRWIAELISSPSNPKLMEITLHVYTVRTRPAQRGNVAADQEFFLSDDRERFTWFQPAEDGSISVMQGKEQVRLVSAAAIP